MPLTDMTEAIDVEKSNTKPLEKTLRPIIFVTWLLGAGIARPGDWLKTTMIIRALHFTICSIIVIYAIKDFFAVGNDIPSDIFKIMFYLNRTTGYVTSYYYVLFGYVHYKKWPRLMEKFSTLDRKMKREITVNDRPILIWEILALIAIFSTGPLALLSNVLYNYFFFANSTLVSDALQYYVVMLTVSTNAMYDIVVLVVFQRYKLVNKLLRQVGDIHAEPWVVQKLQRLREIHHDICEIVNFMNGIHGLHLLLMSANSLMMVVTRLFRLYLGMVYPDVDIGVPNNYRWVIWAIQFALTCNICTKTCDEASKTGVLIHEIDMKKNQSGKKRIYNATNRRSICSLSEPKKNEDICVQNAVTSFSSQLQQHKVAFSACGFFELNNATLQSFIGVIATYLIIVIQFYNPLEREKVINSSHPNSASNLTLNSTNGITAG